MNTQLTVYKASAGSGKTFTLAREYMTLVINDPTAFRTILAVTFTNKATEEMKQRILSQLYAIANDLPEAGEYLRQIQERLPHMQRKRIIENAGEALSLLIHNYNYFRVETIDTFFQSVLRNLARELDLTANLRIGLNDYQVEQQAVDELIESLESTNKLLFWILDYIHENIADNKSWNVIGQIKKFGENIFKDFYKENAKALNERLGQEGFFKEYTAKLKDMRKQAKDSLLQIAETFFDALDENGLTADDFALKGKGIYGYFRKLKNGDFDDDKIVNSTLCKCLEAPKNWVKASDAKKGCPALDLVNSMLFDLLKFSEENRPKMLYLYKSATLTLRHINQLRLLNSIELKVRELNQTANRFLLSDTQTLLHSLVKGTDSPFIFEKIGTRLEHIMIDEFQDTSTIQWRNFRVLLDETMSHENGGNLIVGDVKQSIYRWRSGDWRLLNNIEDEFRHSGKSLKVEVLDTNRRSEANVVCFNNAFFPAAVSLEASTLEESSPDGAAQMRAAYKDVVQGIPEGKQAQRKGYVRIELLPRDGKEEDGIMQRILQVIDELTGNGIPENKIAILTRNNSSIQAIADFLSCNSSHKLVSDEAFRLDASQAVKLIVTALRFLDNPEDAISEAILKEFACQHPHQEDIAHFLKAHRLRLLQMPFYDLAEKICSMLNFNGIPAMAQQGAYMCAFFDQLTNYLADHTADVTEFLAEWDATIHSKSIQSDKTNGIRLMTIHKSKGLEVDNVIIPFCDWTLEKSNIIWCSPGEEPFGELPIIPIDFSSKMMKNSVYEADYELEHLQNMVDNLNLLYVAFTRARQHLFVMGKRGNGNARSYTIEQALPSVRETLGESGTECALEGIGSDNKTESILFEYGDIARETTQDKPTDGNSQNIFGQPHRQTHVDIVSCDKLPEFRESNKSKDFIQGDEEEELHKHYVKMGTVLHQLFSTIQTHEDMGQALRQFELDGIIYDDDISRERLEKLLRKRLETPQIRDWFSDKWKVFNECSIIQMSSGKLQEQRPDRVIIDEEGHVVVIDFKFGKPRPAYQQQVRNYMSLLRGMGYEQTRGYLWYVYPNNIEEVK